MAGELYAIAAGVTQKKCRSLPGAAHWLSAQNINTNTVTKKKIMALTVIFTSIMLIP